MQTCQFLQRFSLKKMSAHCGGNSHGLYSIRVHEESNGSHVFQPFIALPQNVHMFHLRSFAYILTPPTHWIHSSGVSWYDFHIHFFTNSEWFIEVIHEEHEWGDEGISQQFLQRNLIIEKYLQDKLVISLLSRIILPFDHRAIVSPLLRVLSLSPSL